MQKVYSDSKNGIKDMDKLVLDLRSSLKQMQERENKQEE